ncbi:MAG: acetyl-CoA hydrolase/transferase C-terminal domain-containing protein [Nocardioidaceae bacterium]
MSTVVTEQGDAEIFGRDQRVQARNLIDRAAHPSVREELWEEARALRLA